MEPRKYDKYNEKYLKLLDEMSVLNEADDENEESQEENKRVTPEQIRVDSLKLALKVIKMFDKVTAEDLLSVSSKISEYLINHQAGNEYDPTDLQLDDNAESNEDETAEDETQDNVEFDDEEFTIDDEPEDTEAPAENNDEDDSEESSEDEETNEGEGILPDDFII